MEKEDKKGLTRRDMADLMFIKAMTQGYKRDIKDLKKTGKLPKHIQKFWGIKEKDQSEND